MNNTKQHEMQDVKFLQWIRDRLVHVYKESPNVDFVLRLEKVTRRFENLLTLEQGYTVIPETTNSIGTTARDVGMEDTSREAHDRYKDKSE